MAKTRQVANTTENGSLPPASIDVKGGSYTYIMKGLSCYQTPNIESNQSLTNEITTVRSLNAKLRKRIVDYPDHLQEVQSNIEKILTKLAVDQAGFVLQQNYQPLKAAAIECEKARALLKQQFTDFNEHTETVINKIQKTMTHASVSTSELMSMLQPLQREREAIRKQIPKLIANESFAKSNLENFKVQIEAANNAKNNTYVTPSVRGG